MYLPWQRTSLAAAFFLCDVFFACACQAIIMQSRAGRGGRGEVVAQGAGKMVKNFKYRARSSLPKQVFLPAAAPADGADGASVVYAGPCASKCIALWPHRIAGRFNQLSVEQALCITLSAASPARVHDWR